MRFIKVDLGDIWVTHCESITRQSSNLMSFKDSHRICGGLPIFIAAIPVGQPPLARMEEITEKVLMNAAAAGDVCRSSAVHFIAAIQKYRPAFSELVHHRV